MQKLLDLTLDAGVLAVSDINSKDDANQYLENLMDWGKLMNEHWISVYLSNLESLSDNGAYPTYEKIKNMIITCSKSECSVIDILKIVEYFCRCPTFQDFHQIKYKHLEINPEIIGLTPTVSQKSDLSECILITAILRKYCHSRLGGYSLILRKISKQIIQVRAQIIEFNHSRVDFSDLPSSLEFFEGNALVYDNFGELIESLDQSTILAGASDDTEIELAIKISLFKLAVEKGEATDWSSINIPAIGSSFRKSCVEVCNSQGESLPCKVLRSILDNAPGQNRLKNRPLTKGKGKNDQQKIRGSDNAKAWRRNIDNEFRLHYWECSDSKVELASVNFHNDYTIPE